MRRAGRENNTSGESQQKDAAGAEQSRVTMRGSLRSIRLLGLCLALGAVAVAAHPGSSNSNTQQPQSLPSYTYLTTSTTSSHRNGAAAPLQPAIVYEATLPQQQQQQQYQAAATSTAATSSPDEASKKVIGSR